MAYGKCCPVCGATVDNNEYDYAKDMCDECSEEHERKQIKRAEVAKLMKSEGVQMRLEDICVLN